MTQFNFTKREFIQDPSKATHCASEDVVYISDRGRPSHVLISIEQYYKLTGAKQNIVDALAMTEQAPDFEPRLLLPS